VNYKLQLTAAEAEIVRTALLHYSNFAYQRAGYIAQKGVKRADGTSYSAADVRAAQDAAMQANLIRSKIVPMDLEDVKIVPPGLPPLPLPRFHGTGPEQGSFCAFQMIDYASAAVAHLQAQLKLSEENFRHMHACAKSWMERSDANRERAQAADSYEKAIDNLRQRLTHAEQVKDKLLNTLVGIHMLLDPPVLTLGSVAYRFKNPMAAEVLHELSNRIRAIPDAIAEAKQ
jgi:hypothetical protein